MAEKQLHGKIIWITGSGRGLGAAAAQELAHRGARVVLSSRTLPELEQVARTIHQSGGIAMPIVCDVTQRNQIEALVRSVREKWGEIEVLVNNAGVGIFKKILQTTERDWDIMMATNLKSAFLCTQAVLPAMIDKQAGHIINIVSVAGQQPYFNCGGYCASKFGMLGFTEVLRLEVRKHRIKITAFLPGATDTLIWGNSDVDRNRMMTAEQVGKTIADICCQEGSHMIEQMIMRPIGGDL